jgi:hypothetical protein
MLASHLFEKGEWRMRDLDIHVTLACGWCVSVRAEEK